MTAFVLGQGRRAGAAAWSGRQAWLDAVEAHVLSLAGSMLLRRRHVSARAVYAVALHDARTATGTSGGDVATAHETVARGLGISRSTVERARRWLREMRLTVVVEAGRYLTVDERRRAGNGQIRVASTRVLTHPPDCGSRRSRRRDVLPRRGQVDLSSPVLNRSSRRAVDNPPRPMWVQRLAGRVAGLLERRGRHVVAHRHIGQLVTGLWNLALPVDVTAEQLLQTVDRYARPDPTGPIGSPLAWFLHQVATVHDRIWEPWLKPTRPLEHEHDFRALNPDGTRGCLTCPAHR